MIRRVGVSVQVALQLSETAPLFEQPYANQRPIPAGAGITTDARFSPLRAWLSGLPPTTITTVLCLSVFVQEPARPITTVPEPPTNPPGYSSQTQNNSLTSTRHHVHRHRCYDLTGLLVLRLAPLQPLAPLPPLPLPVFSLSRLNLYPPA